MNKSSTLRDFEVVARLGEGSFSSVYKVRRYDDNTLYAMKKVKIGQMSETQKANSLNEVRILASMNHPNVINYKEAFFDDFSQTLCVVMEIAENGDILKKVNDHIKNHTFFNESEIWKALIHMTKGLQALHGMEILHRDLKCANVFCTSDNVFKLGDLNVSKVVKKGMARTQTGTPYYSSPEVWKDRPYDLKCDIWSLGCVIYEMAALKPPFRASNLKELYNKIQKGIFDRIPSFYSDDLQNVINMCMKVNPVLRPNTGELLANPLVMKHSLPSDIYSPAPKQCALLKTIVVPKNLKSLKEALPASKYEIETKLENQVMERRPSERVSSVRSLGRVAEVVETPKIIQGGLKRFQYPVTSNKRPSSAERPESAQKRPSSGYVAAAAGGIGILRRPESANRVLESPSKKIVAMPRIENKLHRDHSYDYLRERKREDSREISRNRSREALNDVKQYRNRSKEVKEKLQKMIEERNNELKRNQSQISRNVSRALEAVKRIEKSNRELITERSRSRELSSKPRSQSFEKENNSNNKMNMIKRPGVDSNNRILYADRKYLPPRHYKV